jgi:hypothetical protein
MTGMSAKSLVLTVVGAACVAAAGAGGFLALRLNSADQAPADNTQAVTPAASQTADRAPASTAAGASVAVAPARTSAKPLTSDARPVERTPVPVPAIPASQTPAARPAAALPADEPSEIPPAQTTPPPPVLPPVDATPPTPLPVLGVPPPAAEPPPDEPEFDQVTVKEDSVIGIRLDSAISTETAQVEDTVTAHVSRDLTVDGRTAIPTGAQLEGTVTFVARGGRLKDRARLGIRFTTLILADHTRVPIDTDTIFRDGESPTGEATSKIGASAVVGAILGTVIGGRRGAIIGGTAGAAGGTAAVMAGGPKDALLPAGAPLTVRLTSPVTLLIARQN